MSPTIADAGKWAGARAARALDLMLGSRAGDSFGILMYHRVTPDSDALRPSENVRPDRFHKQMEGLLERGFRFQALRSVLDGWDEGGPPASKTVVVTFDDGYENVYNYAWPILQRLRIPATIFLTTAFVDAEEPFPFDPWGRAHHESAPPEMWRPLSWEQCLRMKATGLIELGSHSHSHSDFRRRPQEFAEDVTTSLDILQQKCSEAVTSFSFPFGGVKKGFAGGLLAEVLRDTGLRCALTTEIELISPQKGPFEWGRIEGVGSDTAGTLQAKLEGWYGWMGYARELFRRISR